MSESVAKQDPSLAPGGAPRTAWTERTLSDAERERLRPFYPVHRSPDYSYLSLRVGAAVAVMAIVHVGLTRATGFPPGTTAVFASGLAAMVAVLAYKPRRLRHAVRSRRARVPDHVWVWPAEVTRWRGKDREGHVLHEARCIVDGQLKAVRLTPEQWETIPEGPAEVEVLPGGHRRLYRFRYRDETFQVHPQVFRLTESQEEEISIATAVAATAAPAQDRGRRRQRRARSDRKKGAFQMRSQDWLWLGLAILVGGGMTLFAIEKANVSTVAPPVSSPQ